MVKKVEFTPPECHLIQANYAVNNVPLYTPEEVIEMIKAACLLQVEICANIGKHYKFGYYKYKKEEMRKAPLVKVVKAIKFPSTDSATPKMIST